MKKNYLLLLLGILGFSATAQIVNIPDPVFKQTLLASYDTNADGEIQESEALQATFLLIYPDVASAEGIQSFTNVTTVNMSGNTAMTSLDIRNLTLLQFIDCRYTNLEQLNFNGANLTDMLIYSAHLTSLDLSSLAGNTNISELDLSDNRLTEIDLAPLSGNTRISAINLSGNRLTSFNAATIGHNLEYLNLRNNLLESLSFLNANMTISDLDISVNPFSSIDLTGLLGCGFNFACTDNPNLTYLKIPAEFSQNSFSMHLSNPNLQTLDVQNGFNDGCFDLFSICGRPLWMFDSHYPANVCVDDIVFGEFADGRPKSEKTFFEYLFANQGVTTVNVSVCGLSTSNFANDDAFKLYPNAADNTVNIAFAKNTAVQDLKIYNLLGQQLLQIQNPEVTKTMAVDVSNLKPGTYFIILNTGNTTKTQRFIKL